MDDQLAALLRGPLSDDEKAGLLTAARRALAARPDITDAQREEVLGALAAYLAQPVTLDDLERLMAGLER